MKNRQTDHCVLERKRVKHRINQEKKMQRKGHTARGTWTSESRWPVRSDRHHFAASPGSIPTEKSRQGRDLHVTEETVKTDSEK